MLNYLAISLNFECVKLVQQLMNYTTFDLNMPGCLSVPY